MCGERDAVVQVKTVNGNHTQVRTAEGVVLNWHPKQKKLMLQGKHEAALRLKELIEALKSGKQKGERMPSPAPTGSDNKFHYTRVEKNSAEDYRLNFDSELVIGLVAPVGTDLATITTILSDRLKTFSYQTTEIKISSEIIAKLRRIPTEPYFDRINSLMTEGNNLREISGDYSVLAKAAAGMINSTRSISADGMLLPVPRRAFIISSLKHPDEVTALRKIYSNGFYLVGVHANTDTRLEFLQEDRRMEEADAKKLIDRDVEELPKSGQHTRDTYHLSDFFVDLGENSVKFKKDIWRVLDLIFGKPFVTPTFDEFAMFMAFSASLRSADLSRQVGAVVTKNSAIVSTGANDVPKFGGGLYWPNYYDTPEIHDVAHGRDYMREGDTNILEKQEIILDILSRVPETERDALKNILEDSKLKNITEYGRVVHAEMEALLACARGGIGTTGAHLYCTTFPCHNCAKHIIASGIERVVYVEPYPKSKALDFHCDAIAVDTKAADKVLFEPFVGVGPRSFFNLFSLNLGSGYEVKRKNKDGKPVDWNFNDPTLRMQMLPSSYIERETITADYVKRLLEKIK